MTDKTVQGDALVGMPGSYPGRGGVQIPAPATNDTSAEPGTALGEAARLPAANLPDAEEPGSLLVCDYEGCPW